MSILSLECTLWFHFLNAHIFFDRPGTLAVTAWPEIFGAVFPVRKASVSYQPYKTHETDLGTACGCMWVGHEA